MKGLPLHRWETVALIFHLICSPITFSSSQAVVSSFSGSHWDLLISLETGLENTSVSLF